MRAFLLLLVVAALALAGCGGDSDGGPSISPEQSEQIKDRAARDDPLTYTFMFAMCLAGEDVLREQTGTTDPRGVFDAYLAEGAVRESGRFVGELACEDAQEGRPARVESG